MPNVSEEPSWLHGHAHDPNPSPPSQSADLLLELPNGAEHLLSAADLKRLPYTEVSDCYVVSTGHGTSGPFRFGGVTLRDFVAAYSPAGAEWTTVDVISGDSFGNRIEAEELDMITRPILLAYVIDGRPLTRGEGLVRLIVPSETDDALRQVKWVAHIRLI